MTSDFEEKLLFMKKQLFLDSVKDVSRVLKIDVPEVRFLESPCSGFDESELAHIHVEEKIVCVSIRNLHRMNFDDIEEVAAHEVSHLIQANHSPDFRKEFVNAKLGAWLHRKTKINQITGKSYTKNGGNLDSKIDKVRCNYHLCRKKTVLKQCRYCRGYFCKKHLKPKPPSMRNFTYSSNDRKVIEHEADKPEGHPDLIYYDHWMQTQEREKQKYRDSLDALLGVNNNHQNLNNIPKEDIQRKDVLNIPTKKPRLTHIRLRDKLIRRLKFHNKELK